MPRTATPLPRGSIVFAALDPAIGHEQRHARPCVVVTPPEIARRFRYPLLVVGPVTGTTGLGDLYPVLASTDRNGFTRPSTALIDNVRAIDPARVRARLGRLDPPEIDAVDTALRLSLGL